eukprot:m.11662 g.11662  ORF g.11662 m.11662 type:complete len:563 (-) comp5755_c0_seq1:351-2039(-)
MLVVVLLMLWKAFGAATAGPIVMGYYTGWTQYRPSPHTFFPETIDATLYTHITYAFAKIDSNFQIQPYEDNDVLSSGRGMYSRFNKHVRNQNPSIKTLLSIGGWRFNHETATKYTFSRMCANRDSRLTFITNVITFVRLHDFDGLDLDWEFPTLVSQGGASQDYDTFPALLRELRSAMRQESIDSGKPQLLLTIAVSPGRHLVPSAYDVPAIYPFVDWVGVMTYDLHGDWEPQTGLHTALYDPKGHGANLNDSMHLWAEMGVPKTKLVVGLATYGRAWTLPSTTSVGVGAPASLGGSQPYTRELGLAAYFEIQNLNARTTCIESQAACFTQKGTYWVSHDTPATIKVKAQYVIDNGFAGVMMWSVTNDDAINGFPLQTTVANTILNGTRFNNDPYANIKQSPQGTCKMWPVVNDREQCSSLCGGTFYRLLDGCSKVCVCPSSCKGLQTTATRLGCKFKCRGSGSQYFRNYNGCPKVCDCDPAPSHCDLFSTGISQYKCAKHCVYHSRYMGCKDVCLCPGEEARRPCGARFHPVKSKLACRKLCKNSDYFKSINGCKKMCYCP